MTTADGDGDGTDIVTPRDGSRHVAEQDQQESTHLAPDGQVAIGSPEQTHVTEEVASEAPLRPRLEHVGTVVATLVILTPVYGAWCSLVSIGLSTAVGATLFEAINQPVPALALNGALTAAILLSLLLTSAFGVFVGAGTGRKQAQDEDYEPPAWLERSVARVSPPVLLVGVIVIAALAILVVSVFSIFMALLLLAASAFGLGAVIPTRWSQVLRVGLPALLIVGGMPFIVSGGVAGASQRDVRFDPVVGMDDGSYVVLPQNGDQLLLFSCDTVDGRVAGVLVSQSSVLSSRAVKAGPSRVSSNVSVLGLLRGDPYGFQLRCPE